RTSGGGDGGEADFVGVAGGEEGWGEGGAAGGGEPDLIEAGDAFEDGGAAALVELGDDVVKEEDGRVVGVVEEAGFGEAQGEGGGADLGAGAEGGGGGAVEADRDVIAVGTDEGEAGGGVAAALGGEGGAEERA